MKLITKENFPALLEGLDRPYHESYLAMYSSIYGGIVTDPVLMMVPIDDHMVHRGDGIFETFKCVNGAIYNLDAHLERLQRSASNLDFKLPIDMEQLREIVLETTRAGKNQRCYIRMFISRGPGSFSVNPYDCPATQLYIVITSAPKSFMETHPEGATVKTSSIPVKHPFFAGVKNCNYLNNVLMKKEAVNAKVDFVVAFDKQGRLGEGATENIGVVTAENILTFPNLDGILMGTTMMRVMELAETAVTEGILKKVCFGDVRRDDIDSAKEILIAGTTTNITKVKTFDGKPVGNGTTPVYNSLSQLLLNDIHQNPKIRTQVFDIALSLQKK